MFSKIMIGIVRGYQILISPFLSSHCRFYPTCSEFAVQAIEKHGAVLGGYCALRRIGKCHPFHSGGVDYVENYESDRGFLFVDSLKKKWKKSNWGGGFC